MNSTLLNHIDPSLYVSDQYFSYVRKAIPKEALQYNRMFRPRLILELHKYSIPDIYDNPDIIRSETGLLLSELADLYSGSSINSKLPGKNELIDLEKTALRPMAETEAKNIHGRYHYLLSPRTGVFHLGLYSADNSILGLASFSINDLTQLNKALPEGTVQQRTLVLSRFITFDNTPFNTPSYFLAQTSKWISVNYPGIDLVISYLDPNLGFSGTIYKAFNAKLIAAEEKKRYLYYNNRYASDRSVIEQFGTADFEKLCRTETGIGISQNPLKPLQVYAWQVSRKLKLRYQTVSQTISPIRNLVG